MNKKRKRIVIIGSTQYIKQMQNYKEELEKDGYLVELPVFDDSPDLDDIGICFHNKKLIKGADEVHLFWDTRSGGSLFDFGMTFALGKKFKVIYLEPKTFPNVMRKYQKITENNW